MPEVGPATAVSAVACFVVGLDRVVFETARANHQDAACTGANLGGTRASLTKLDLVDILSGRDQVLADVASKR
jgi:hypothetical protein